MLSHPSSRIEATAVLDHGQRRNSRSCVIAVVAMLALALGGRSLLALHLPNDDPDDAGIYTQLALNLLNHHTYSSAPSAPYSPCYFRMPGYALFVAGVYAAFGQGNDQAVRLAQATADTLTCWLAALLAVAWCPPSWDRERRRRVLLIALALAVVCPFVMIYVTTIMTEVLTTLVWVAAALLATRALGAVGPHAPSPPALDKNEAQRTPLAGVALYVAIGVLCGIGTLLRPDNGLIAAGIGVTLCAKQLWQAQRARKTLGNGVWRGPSAVLLSGLSQSLLLVLAFVAVLTPWTLRNAQVFHRFQPLVPRYAALQGEFVSSGYRAWLRTWVDDFRYVAPLEWQLDTSPIRVDQIPERAFASKTEKDRVAQLLERYNHAPETNDSAAKPITRPARVLMTPDIDAGFGALAKERLVRNPLEVRVLVPARRALFLWFDTHSDYYPFAGELSPWKDVKPQHRFFRVLFVALIWVLTLLSASGLRLLWKEPTTRWWLLLVAALCLPRLLLLATLENPEPRYTVEFFPFLIALSALALAAPRGTPRKA